MNSRENYCCHPQCEENFYCPPPIHCPKPCCPCSCEHTCDCECECKCKCPCDCGCEQGINLYVKGDCCNHCNCSTSCEPNFSSYLCQFLNKKVLITIGCKRLRVVILEVSCSTAKCLLLGAGKLIYLNVDRIDNVRPLCC